MWRAAKAALLFSWSLVARAIDFAAVRRPDRRQDLVPDILEIEAGRLLHRRELNECLAHCGHFLLHVDEPPELVAIHVHHLRRAIVEPAAFERVEPEIEKPRPIQHYFWSEPALGLGTAD